MNILKQIRNYYRSLSNVKKLIVLFFLYTAYWYVAWYVLNYFTDEPAKPFLHQLLKALYFGVVFTLLYHWKMVKQLVKRS